MRFKLYYTDSKGEKRYLQAHDLQGTGDWGTDSQDVVLRRRWAEAQRGMLYEIEGAIDPERDEFVKAWSEIHK
jgi:hypothetical protein